MLRVDARRHPPGPVLNTAVISAAAPTYAPPGQHLIAASAVVERDGTVPAEMRCVNMPQTSCTVINVGGHR